MNKSISVNMIFICATDVHHAFHGNQIFFFSAEWSQMHNNSPECRKEVFDAVPGPPDAEYE